MTRGSIREYTEAVQGRYLWASKKEKSRILDEFTRGQKYRVKNNLFNLLLTSGFCLRVVKWESYK